MIFADLEKFLGRYGLKSGEFLHLRNGCDQYRYGIFTGHGFCSSGDCVYVRIYRRPFCERGESVTIASFYAHPDGRKEIYDWHLQDEEPEANRA